LRADHAVQFLDALMQGERTVNQGFQRVRQGFRSGEIVTPANIV
jgi:hypothetical protein